MTAPDTHDDHAQQPPRRALPGRLVWVVCLGVAGLWAVLDQATKVLAVALLPADGSVGADLGFMDLRLVRNPNAAFGIPGFPGLFLIVTVVVLVLIVRTLPGTDRLSLAFAYGLVAGGAVGNAIDRVLRDPGFPAGRVIDFLDLRWWPVFNLADSGIVTGSLLVVLLMLRVDAEERAAEARRAAHRSVRPGTASPRRPESGTGGQPVKEQ